MPAPKPISKDMCLAAMNKTKSEIRPNKQDRDNLQGPFTIVETDN